jgi:hypothetical protein
LVVGVEAVVVEEEGLDVEVVAVLGAAEVEVEVEVAGRPPVLPELGHRLQ